MLLKCAFRSTKKTESVTGNTVLEVLTAVARMQQNLAHAATIFGPEDGGTTFLKYNGGLCTFSASSNRQCNTTQTIFKVFLMILPV
jgi:hypothetical protein